jgi:error-prone DNA polymerase
VPLEPARMPGRVVVQWNKDDCADLGIVKVDLLGLGMLAVLEESATLLRSHHGIEIDYAHLPPDDPAVYRMLRAADTVGVFQVESRAQMATLPRMRPERFYDLVVEVAIIRPGPIVGKMVNPYLARRNGQQPVRYPHPSLEPILRRTLGIPLFQEQLIRIAMTAAGFSGGQAEELRRAMGFKRSVERMKVIEAELRAGMSRKGIVHKAQEEIVQGIKSFALYGFPESHAASFALIAYASAYLKAHHPAAFTCALLNNFPMGFYHPATLVKDAQRHGVACLPVDVTCSQWDCSLEDNNSGTTAVRLGLKYLRGLRAEVAQRLVAARPFSSLGDLCRRVELNASERATLAEVGAFAALGGTRRQVMWQLEAFGRSGELFAGVESGDGQTDSPLPEMNPGEEVAADFRGTGLTAGPHPMSFVRERLQARGVLSAHELQRTAKGQRALVAGLVIVRQRPSTAKGVVFVTVEDETGFANAVVPAAQFDEHRALLVSARALVIGGVVQQNQGVTSLKADRFWALDSAEIARDISHDFR